MSALALQSFGFGDQLVRAVEREGLAWFVAKDVCAVLDIGNSRQAVAKLEEDEKGVISTDTLGGAQELTIVSESGVYALIFRSRKPAARQFRKWVTSEVLPAIRETGRFEPEVANDGMASMTMPETPDAFEAMRLKLQIVRAARIAFGAAAARRAWMLAGLPNLSEPEPNWQLSTIGEEYPTVQAWLMMRVVRREGHRVAARALYRDYVRYCTARDLGPDEIMSESALGKVLTKMGMKAIASNGSWRIDVALAD